MSGTGPAFYTNRRRQPGQFTGQNGRHQPVQAAQQHPYLYALFGQATQRRTGIMPLQQLETGLQRLRLWRAALAQGRRYLANQRPLSPIALQLQADETADGGLPVADQFPGKGVKKTGIDRAGPVRPLHEAGVARHQQQPRKALRMTPCQFDGIQPAHRPAQQVTVGQCPLQTLDLDLEGLASPGALSVSGQIEGQRFDTLRQHFCKTVENAPVESPAMEHQQSPDPTVARCCHRTSRAVKVRVFICRLPLIVDSSAVVAVLLIITAYLIGSFSSAITLSRLMGFEDPRSQGSRNPGATNVLRIAGKKAAALTLFGDLLKGLLPVLAARALGGSDLAVALVGFAAFIGHCYPLWYRFEGGKGVATAIGFLLGYAPLLGLVIVALWLIIAKLFRLSSLAALIAFAALPALHAWLDGDARVTALFILLDLILIWRHRGNIRRLVRGEEPASRL